MSTRTLTDELRSTLLFHALEAPEPNATVDRILNDTVGAEMVLGGPRRPAESTGGAVGTVGAVRGGWRPSIQQVVAASVVAVLLLAVAGINSQRARNTGDGLANRSVAGAALGGPAASQAPADGSMVLPSAPGRAQDKAAAPEASAQAAPPVNPTYAGKALDCAAIRGSRLVTGQWDDYLSPSGELNYIFEFLCVGLNGERSASELQVFQLVNGQLKYQRTLLPASAGEHLDFLTAGGNSARVQVVAHRQTAGSAPGAVLSTTWDLSLADPGDGYTFTVAEPCGRSDSDPEADLPVTATLSVVPDAPAPAWRLTVRNAGSKACGLEGFPVVRAQRGGTTLATALPTLSGPVGGVTRQAVPPILVLPPQHTATALIEQSASAAGTCQPADQLAITLPDGVSLSPLRAQVAACGLIVHPLVDSPTGSD